MIFTVAVHGSPYASQANLHALKFCESAVGSDHQIARIFFFHEGVYTALRSQVPPQDEINIQSLWQDFSVKHTVELAVCIANGLKRGVLSESEQKRYGFDASTLAEHFQLTGLGQLIDAIAGSDRYVEFP